MSNDNNKVSLIDELEKDLSGLVEFNFYLSKDKVEDMTKPLISEVIADNIEENFDDYFDADKISEQIVQKIDEISEETLLKEVDIESIIKERVEAISDPSDIREEISNTIDEMIRTEINSIISSLVNKKISELFNKLLLHI
jgi:hypothetical protein